jgi:hypothetical protein
MKVPAPLFLKIDFIMISIRNRWIQNSVFGATTGTKPRVLKRLPKPGGFKRNLIVIFELLDL